MRDGFNVLGLVGWTNVDVVEDDDVGAVPCDLLDCQSLCETAEEILAFVADVRLQGAHQSLLRVDRVADSVA